MKKLLLTGAIALSAGLACAQTNLFSETFESGGGSFTTNTAEMSGVSGTGGTNFWTINNSYNGGSGTLVCMGFPLTFTVATTPAQPGGIGGSPNSNYMHIVSNAALSNGISNACFAAADGFCFNTEYNFSRMNTDVSTLGMNSTEFSFWYLCGGNPGTIYGEVYYSLDGGTTWVLKQGALNNQTTWNNLVLTDSNWDNQASLRFGFRFVNSTTSAAVEPSFAVDDITITATTSVSASIATSAFSPTSWCYGTTISDVLDFTAAGTYNAGNVFSAELSDLAGSFAAPTVVGTLNSTVSGSLSINVTIPGTVPVGTGYRLRVVSSNPVVVGTDNGVDLAVNAIPTVSMSTLSDVCVYTPSFALSGGSPAGGTYSGTGVNAGMFDPATAGVGTHIITYNYTDGNNCSSSANQSIIVDGCTGLSEMSADGISLYPNPATESFVVNTELPINGIEILDANGRVVKRFPSNVKKYSISELREGLYFVRIDLENHYSLKQLLVH